MSEGPWPYCLTHSLFKAGLTFKAILFIIILKEKNTPGVMRIAFGKKVV